MEAEARADEERARLDAEEAEVRARRRAHERRVQEQARIGELQARARRRQQELGMQLVRAEMEEARSSQEAGSEMGASYATAPPALRRDSSDRQVRSASPRELGAGVRVGPELPRLGSPCRSLPVWQADANQCDRLCREWDDFRDRCPSPPVYQSVPDNSTPARPREQPIDVRSPDVGSTAERRTTRSAVTTRSPPRPSRVVVQQRTPYHGWYELEPTAPPPEEQQWRLPRPARSPQQLAQEVRVRRPVLLEGTSAAVHAPGRDDWRTSAPAFDARASHPAQAWAPPLPRPAQHSVDPQVQFQALLTQQAQMIGVLQAPKVTLPSFNGDPMMYTQFMRAFEDNVERVISDDAARLSRLMQLCTGDASGAIEGCMLMPPEMGYRRAKQLLQTRFGNEYTIVSMWLHKLMNLKTQTVREAADELRSCWEALAALGATSELDTMTNMTTVVGKIPSSLQTRWRTHAYRMRTATGRRPRFLDLVAFVEEVADELNDPVWGSRQQPRRAQQQQQQQKSQRTMNFAAAAGSVCFLCSSDHDLQQCPEMKRKSPEERLKVVYEKKLCFSCLGAGHAIRDCEAKTKCQIEGCGQRHATLLHGAPSRRKRESPKRSSRKPDKSAMGAGEAAAKSHTSAYIAAMKVALPIVPVRVRAPGGAREVSTFALLDSGSTTTFCSERLLDKMGVRGGREMLVVDTLEKKGSATESRVTPLTVIAEDGTEMVIGRAYSRPLMPIQQYNIATRRDAARWPHLKGIPLSSPDEMTKAELLIGNDCPAALIPLETIQGRDDEPYAVRTRLGWALSGPVRELEGGEADDARNCFARASTSVSCDRADNAVGTGMAHQAVEDEQLGAKVERFWEMEESGLFDSSRGHSVCDRAVLSRWQKDVRMVEGHYQLPIPFREPQPRLPGSREMAVKRLQSLGKKLNRDQDLHAQYVRGMQDLMKKGYAEEVPEDELTRDDGKVWYLPHHPVISPNKDKPRIVFDCAARSGGASLNDRVLQGPDLTNSLVGVLTRFRQREIAFMADIEAMFHQVKVAPEDRDVLRFLWWPDGDVSSSPKTYRMTVHLFGGTWSPSCCTYALNKTAEDGVEKYSAPVRETVKENFYVDDCLKSVATKEDALALIEDLQALLAEGGFRVTKFVCNSPEVMEKIPVGERSKQSKALMMNASNEPTAHEERALGVYWDVGADCLGFHVRTLSKPLTKRGLLSMLSSVYDPLGLASPFIMTARRIVQELCKQKAEWDEPIPHEQREKWKQWIEALPSMTEIQVPRCMQPSAADTEAEVVSRQLHHFADASEVAYGVVTYLRTVYSSGEVRTALVMSKSRLAPMKPMTIPRLELSAATLATRQDESLRREMNLELEKSQFWSDSTVVLQYIYNEEARYQTFVANRVAEIRSRSDPKQWRHVPTADNPADDASRGAQPSELARPRWLHGPAFLTQDPDLWPRSPVPGPVSSDDPEVRRERTCMVAVAKPTDDSPAEPIERLVTYYSSWPKLLRGVAWILKLKEILRRRAQPTSRLEVSDVSKAKQAVVKYLQERRYPEELEDIRRGRPVSKKSPLAQLAPELKDGLIVATGRLKHAAVEEATKCPVVLPPHPATEALIRHVHERLGHVGREYTLAEIRTQWWVVGGTAVVKRMLRSCQRCRRLRAKPCTQQMADLPEDRIRPGGPAFTKVGVDFFGPCLVKRGRGTEKRYGCLFTCLVTRAVHMEVAHSLTTDSFLKCLFRFMARRGEPELLRSDNGLNFVGASRELKRAVEALSKEGKIHNQLLDRGIKWVFNTPFAPHMGGVWERQIGTVKRVIDGLVKEQRMTDEDLLTTLIIAEGIVNNRPITAVTSDPSDLEVLTPNHLLLLRPATTPRGLYGDDGCSTRTKWRQVQQLAAAFWRRWIREYLPSLRSRTKWNSTERNVAVGDLVMIVETDAPRGEWPLARVMDVTNGRDGLVRSVRVRTKSTEVTRPISKICVLEEAQ